MKSCLIDSGFWIGYFNERDEHHQEAIEVFETIGEYKLIIPFPTLYEFLNTRFSRDIRKINELERIFKNLDIFWLPDDNYRDDLVENFIGNNKKGQKISSVDIIINNIIEDRSVKVNYLITFNPKDFRENCERVGVLIFPD